MPPIYLHANYVLQRELNNIQYIIIIILAGACTCAVIILQCQYYNFLHKGMCTLIYIYK